MERGLCICGSKAKFHTFARHWVTGPPLNGYNKADSQPQRPLFLQVSPAAGSPIGEPCTAPKPFLCSRDRSPSPVTLTLVVSPPTSAPHPPRLSALRSPPFPSEPVTAQRQTERSRWKKSHRAGRGRHLHNPISTPQPMMLDTPPPPAHPYTASSVCFPSNPLNTKHSAPPPTSLCFPPPLLPTRVPTPPVPNSHPRCLMSPPPPTPHLVPIPDPALHPLPF
ncbi:glycogen synthase kinase-3 alpha [Platysternon megacephalum]|uniref:Glycogen synthase kinase-3 alpha n=1 Tax=Platysternon megacephalum TaxID=55544 RepID=A0A4D9DKQ1_9SAUR|nr:glycogen synthase kinase-3 alpha [Platysternon megacephalum]